MTEETDILARDEFFWCEKLRCRLRKTICISRQNHIHGPATRSVVKHYYQGCGDCEQGRRLMETTNICEKCKVTVATHPKNAKVPRWCAACWGEKLGRSRKSAESAVKELPKMEPPEKVIVETRLEIDFSNHAALLDKLRMVAEEEVRRPEDQALYLLERVLSLLPEGREGTMKLTRSKLINETIDVKFKKHITIPIWVIGDQRCASCGWRLTENNQHYCIVALSCEGKFVFHENCFSLPDRNGGINL